MALLFEPQSTRVGHSRNGLDAGRWIRRKVAGAPPRCGGLFVPEAISSDGITVEGFVS